jgi:hypothetical protein
MSENPVSTMPTDPNPTTSANEPPRSPLKLLAIIALLLIMLLAFGAMDR